MILSIRISRAVGHLRFSWARRAALRGYVFNRAENRILELSAKEYKERAESLVPPLRSITMGNRHASEVAMEVAAVLDKLVAKIRNGSTNF